MIRRKRYETKNFRDEDGNSGDYYSGEEEILIESPLLNKNLKTSNI